MRCWKWEIVLLVAAMAAVTVVLATANAQDGENIGASRVEPCDCGAVREEPARNLGPPMAVTAGPDSRVRLLGQEDPAFDRYIDWRLLGQAWNEQDASRLADLALGLVDGERVLLRSHPALSAEQLVKWAARVAAEHRDRRTLERLTKGVEANERLTEQVHAAQKLLAQSRDASGPLGQLAVEEMTPDQFALYRWTLKRIQAATVLQDRDDLLAISEWLGNKKPSETRATLLHPEAHDQVAQLADQALEAMPNDSPQLDRNALLLKKLAFVSRRTGPSRPSSSGFSGASYTRPARPQANGSYTRPTRPQANGSYTRPARPQANGSYTRPTRPQANGSYARPARPQANGSHTRPTRPQAAGVRKWPGRPSAGGVGQRQDWIPDWNDGQPDDIIPNWSDDDYYECKLYCVVCNKLLQTFYVDDPRDLSEFSKWKCSDCGHETPETFAKGHCSHIWP